MAGKTAHDVVVAEADAIFAVARLRGGYTRYFPPRGGFTPGLGGALSMCILPQDLRSTYGGRATLGVAVFLTVRPTAREM